VAHAAAQGDFSARLGMRFLNNRGQLISALLIGNNVCNVLATLLFVELYERINGIIVFDLSRIPSPESWFLTPVMLIFSEIIPKSLYRTYPFRLTMKTVPLVAVLFFLLSPVFWVFGAVGKIFGYSRGAYERSANVREEIVLVAVEGAKRGTIFESADEIMKNTLDMKGKRIGSISVGINEWKKNRAVYRSSQMLTEFSKGAGAGAQADEAVVFDDALLTPIGYVPLLEAAAHRGDSGGLKTFGSLMKPLPRVKSSMEILPCLRRIPPDSPRFFVVLEGDKPVGMLDKMALFETAFAR
jgi:CBS domain containing-hemolysin-like protein